MTENLTPRLRVSRARRRVLAVAAVALVLASVTGCEPEGSSKPSGSVPTGRFVATTITPDGNDRYTISDQGSGFVAKAAKSNKDWNLRLAVTKDDAPMSVDQTSCITWNGPNDRIDQPGVTLRTRTDGDRTRTIMVTNNILFFWRGSFNVHLADSKANPVIAQVTGANLDSIVLADDELRPLPWRMCARVQGTQLDVKAWSIPSETKEPAWGDSRYGYSIRLPKSWVFAGRPGAYIGHIEAGRSARIDDVSTSVMSSTSGAGYWSRLKTWADRLYTSVVGVR